MANGWAAGGAPVGQLLRPNEWNAVTRGNPHCALNGDSSGAKAEELPTYLPGRFLRRWRKKGGRRRSRSE